MLRTIMGCMGIVLAGVSHLQATTQEPVSSSPAPASVHRALVNQYCVTCHNERLRTANLLLDQADVEDPSASAEVWEKVVRKLRTRAMPPSGMPRPEDASYDSFVNYLETELDRAAAASPNPGRPAVHRLNRTEYTNAILDLLELAVDGTALLPGDDSGYGFDNNGDVLTVSPMLLERYLSAAGKITRLSIGEPVSSPIVQRYSVPKGLVQEDRISDDLPFGSRGGTAVRHYFPLDGEYVIQVRLQRGKLEGILGLAEEHQLDIRLDGERLQLFTIGGADALRGRRQSGDLLGQYERTADAELEVRFSTTAGMHLIGVAFLKDTVKKEGVRVRRDRNTAFYEGVSDVIVIGPYNATGPGDTPSRRRIFVCWPASQTEEEPCAARILSSLARRAYRRPVTERDIQPLLALYREGRSQRGFEAGIGMALRGILISTGFLFRVEADPEPERGVSPGTAYEVSDLELASRLAFFLWSSIPDNELLSLAERGRLKNPAVLEQQVLRMLADPRAQTMMNNFAGQWLYVRNMATAAPNPDEFPEFDENLRRAFQRETALFFQDILREDRSVLDLLDADYTFVNERLARHYGIPDVYGNNFRRVTLADGQRGGLLGQGSILTVTSYATRTSPTLRGKWLLENILGTPPPPPPPDVPSLNDRGEDGEILSVREQLELHRASPACASCHKLMDPLGFALENFDGIGRWRTSSGSANTPIDASGVLPDGSGFDGPAGLRQVLLNRREDFVRTVTDRLLTYALGRGVEYYDQPAVRKIVREAAPSNYRWSALVLGIVRSIPFQMRRSPEQEEVP